MTNQYKSVHKWSKIVWFKQRFKSLFKWSIANRKWFRRDQFGRKFLKSYPNQQPSETSLASVNSAWPWRGCSKFTPNILINWSLPRTLMMRSFAWRWLCLMRRPILVLGPYPSTWGNRAGRTEQPHPLRPRRLRPRRRVSTSAFWSRCGRLRDAQRLVISIGSHIWVQKQQVYEPEKTDWPSRSTADFGSPWSSTPSVPVPWFRLPQKLGDPMGFPKTLAAWSMLLSPWWI